MFDVNKNVDSLDPDSLDRESSLSNLDMKQNLINPRLSEETVISSQPNMIALPAQRRITLKIQISEQLLKACSVVYFAFGIIVAISYFIYTIMQNNTSVKTAWRWIGSINSLLIFIVVNLIVVSKVMIYKKRHFIALNRSGTLIVFYCIVVVSAGLSWFSLIFVLVEKIKALSDCKEIADILLPITRLLFLMAAITQILDIINSKIEKNVENNFYLIYKSTSFLLFVTCLNILVFELFHALAMYLQTIPVNYKNNIFQMSCLYSSKYPFFDDLSKEMQRYFNVFSLIFSLVTVVMLIKPLEQFRENFDNLQRYNGENQLNAPINNLSSLVTVKCRSKFISLFIILSILIFLLSSFNVPIKFLFANNTTGDNLKIVSNSLPVSASIICGFIDLYLLKKLYESFPFQNAADSRLTFIYMVWLCLFGIVLCVFRNFIVSLDKLFGSYCDWKCDWINIVGVTAQSLNIFESMFQAMMLDYLFRLKWEFPVSKAIINKIYYCCMILIAFNLGCLITNYVDEIGKDSILPLKDNYHILIYDITSVLVSPLILLYRAFCSIILIEFCNKMVLIRN